MPFLFLIKTLLCGAGYYLHTLDRVCGVISFRQYAFAPAPSAARTSSSLSWEVKTIIWVSLENSFIFCVVGVK